MIKATVFSTLLRMNLVLLLRMSMKISEFRKECGLAR